MEHQQHRWTLWRLKLPETSDEEIERFFDSVGYPIEEPRWKLEVLSVPHSIANERNGELLFYSQESLLLKVDAPYAGAEAVLDLESSSIEKSWTISLGSESRAAIFELYPLEDGRFSISLQNSDWTRRRVEIGDIFDFDLLEAKACESLDLVLRIGEEELHPYSSLQAIDLQRFDWNQNVQLEIVGLEFSNIDLRVAIIFSGESHSIADNLSLRAAEIEILRILKLGRPGRMKIDAGGFGFIDLNIICAPAVADIARNPIKRTYSRSRVDRWLTTLSFGQTDPIRAFDRGPHCERFLRSI